MISWLMPIVGYLCGAVPFGVVIARAKGVDLFQAGSGNVGATNVGRVMGKPSGFLVFLLDFLKGIGPTWLATWLSGETVAALTGLACILGHMFSPLLKFRGGKGVATGAGVMAVLMPASTGLAVLGFAATITAGCTMSPASIVAALVLAGSRMSMTAGHLDAATILAIAVALLVIIRHRANLARLRTGTESRLKCLTRLSKATPALHALALGLWCGSGVFFAIVAAPEFVAQLIPPYYLVQAIYGVLATGTALGWLITRPGRGAKWRAGFLVTALILAAIGWPLSGYVSELRGARHADVAAKSAFVTWHLVSLFLNLAGTALLIPALALAGYVRPQSPPVATGGL